MVKTILAVEDDPQIGMLLEMLLESPELRVLHCMTGAEGWQSAQQENPDLIILDVKLPEMTGWEVFDHVRDHADLKAVPVIMLSVSQAEMGRRELFQQSEINHYMTKPFELLVLRRKIGDILGIEHWQMADSPVRPKPQTAKLKPIDKALLNSKNAKQKSSKQASPKKAAGDD